MSRIGLVALATLLALTACSKKPISSTAPPATTAATPTATATGSPPPSSPPTVGPTGSPSDLIEFSVDGAGPYQLGATLTALKAAGLDSVTPGGGGCPNNTTAQGTGVWSGVQLSFHQNGELYLAVNKSTSIPTPSGAWLGTSLTDLKKIYANIQGQQLTRGTNSAYLVTTLSGRGILFDLDAAKTVSAMTAGDSSYLRANFSSGAPYC